LICDPQYTPDQCTSFCCLSISFRVASRHVGLGLDRFKTSTSRQLRFTLPSNAALGFSGHGPSALNTHGTHAVQKLVETLRSPEQVRPNHLRRPASTLHREREEWTWWTHTGGGNALAFEQPPICDRLHCIPVEYHTARQCDGGWACSHGVDESHCQEAHLAPRS
jgi:hypothetical protein